MWQLPLYELALMTAERARDMGMPDVRLTIVTPDEAPLAVFGPNVSEAVGRLLDEAGIAVHSSTVAEVPAAGALRLAPADTELAADRIVALPTISGPGIRGLPSGGDDHGFIPIDAHCAVPGTGGRIFAAGDATTFPIKHGGLGAAQADTAAAAIAHLADADADEPQPFQPVIHGMLLTGAAPLYMTAHLTDGGGFASEVSDRPLWPSGAKVAADELNAYLADRTT